MVESECKPSDSSMTHCRVWYFLIELKLSRKQCVFKRPNTIDNSTSAPPFHVLFIFAVSFSLMNSIHHLASSLQFFPPPLPLSLPNSPGLPGAPKGIVITWVKLRQWAVKNSNVAHKAWWSQAAGSSSHKNSSLSFNQRTITLFTGCQDLSLLQTAACLWSLTRHLYLSLRKQETWTRKSHFCFTFPQ